MRDISLGDTIYPRFTTRSFSTGAPATLAGTPVLSVYEENNTTQITSGVSVSVDYDSVTGLNQATIVATAGNGYEVGKSYDLVITTGTVGGVSVVGEVVFSFTVGVLAKLAALATAQTDLDTLTGADGVTLATSQPNYAPLKSGANMTESYPTDGAVMTPEQALYAIVQGLTEFERTGTTVTVKKRDASTTAFTLTLDALPPTSSTQSS